MMNFSELGRMIEQLSKDRGIKKDVVVDGMEQAFVVAARKKYGIQGEYEAKYNFDDEVIEIYQYKNVVKEVNDPVLEISYEDAKVLDPDCELGDQLGLRFENPEFSRVDIQTIKQIIFQKVRDAEREILFKEFKHREKDLITGIARRYERGNVIVDLGKADAILSRREIIPGEVFKAGDRIQAYLSEVVMTNKGPEIRLSRTSPLFLIKLFEMEVPEIPEGSIVIRAAAREPGQRAKIAVSSSDKDLDPVGACVGMKGNRVQNVVNELQGEKIDIVRWFEDLETFVRQALAPAEIANIRVGEQKSLDVVVEDDQLSLAIGRRGQNVRLAAMLTGCKINIVSKTKLQKRVARLVQYLSQVDGINETVAQMLVYAGVTSIKDILAMSIEQLSKILGNDAQAEKIVACSKAAFDEGKIGTEENLQEDEEDIVSASAIPMKNGYIRSEAEQGQGKDNKEKFSEAEKRLREELAAFKLK